MSLVLAAPAHAANLGDLGGKAVGAAKDVSGAAEQAVGEASRVGNDLYEGATGWKDQAPEALRRRKCDEAQGRWVELLQMTPCANGQTTVSLDGETHTQACGAGHTGGDAELQCVYFDDDGRVYFNDGPSVPPAIVTISGWVDDSVDQIRYEEIFWQAGVDHDHCYHANPSTYGLNKADCDDRFIADLEALCVSHDGLGVEWFHNDVCHTYAAIMYGAVRSGGEESWAAYDTAAAYPQGPPMWRQLELDEDPLTPQTQADIDGLLIKFNFIDDPAS